MEIGTFFIALTVILSVALLAASAFGVAYLLYMSDRNAILQARRR